MSDYFSFKYIIYFYLDEEKCVVYSNNGTARSGVGTYVVKPLTIKWKTKNFSDLGVITESRSTLAELTKTTLDVLVHQLHHAISIVLKMLLERLIL